MIPDLYAPRREPHSLLTILASFLGGSNPRTLLIMPVYSSGSRPAWSSDGRCPRDEAAQEEEEAAARICYGYSTVGTVLYSLGLFYPGI